jgi:hypothetical protein
LQSGWLIKQLTGNQKEGENRAIDEKKIPSQRSEFCRERNPGNYLFGLGEYN